MNTKEKKRIKKGLLTLLNSKEKCSSILLFNSLTPTDKPDLFFYNWFEQNKHLTDDLITYLLSRYK
jgi:hypothetical protein